MSTKMEVLTSKISFSRLVLLLFCRSGIILNWSSVNSSSSRRFVDTFLTPEKVFARLLSLLMITTSSLFTEFTSGISYKFIWSTNYLLFTNLSHHFSFFFFVAPVYFFASFFDNSVWSRHPIPPSQWPPLSTPLTNSFLQNIHYGATGCSIAQNPHSIVIPGTFSCGCADPFSWHSSQLKTLPQHPYRSHLKLSFMCLQVPLPTSSFPFWGWKSFTKGLKCFNPL